MLQQNRAAAVAAAVDALSRLHGREIKAKLDAFINKVKAEEDKAPDLTSDAAHGPTASTSAPTAKASLNIGHDVKFLNNRDPLFWHNCFVRLFPRGDCTEKCLERSCKIPAWRWAKTLLTRADTSLRRQDVEFVASLYNVQLRRDQVHAVEACIEAPHFTKLEKEEVQGFFCI